MPIFSGENYTHILKKGGERKIFQTQFLKMKIYKEIYIYMCVRNRNKLLCASMDKLVPNKDDLCHKIYVMAKKKKKLQNIRSLVTSFLLILIGQKN